MRRYNRCFLAYFPENSPFNLDVYLFVANSNYFDDFRY